jgi:hypothetical protein
MLLSAVSVLVVAQSSSEVSEGLMNHPVFPPSILWRQSSIFWIDLCRTGVD